MFNYHNPTSIHFGRGCVIKLAELVRSFTTKRILLVTGSQSLRVGGGLSKIFRLLSDFEVCLHEGVSAHPDLNGIKSLVEVIQKQKIEMIVAAGGGSVLDVSKIASLFAAQSADVDTLFKTHRDLSLPEKIPLIAIPTTSGTGSEVTKWSTVWDAKTKKKLSVEHDKLYPDIAIVDPELVLTAPPSLTASTGLDALCQAIEAYWSKNSQSISDMFAEKAVDLLVHNLVETYQHPSDLDRRELLAHGSLFAGLAFSNTRTTSCHSISYPLTAHFGVSHGLAVALTMPPMLIFNAPVINNKMACLEKIFGVKSVGDLAKAFTKMMRDMRLPTRLSELNILEKDIPSILDNSFTTERMQNNPREVSRADLEKILLELL